MKKWSEKLIELSEEYLNYSGCCVKSLSGDFGILIIDYENTIYTINIFNSNKTLIFNSVKDIIDSGWAVD